MPSDDGLDLPRLEPILEKGVHEIGGDDLALVYDPQTQRFKPPGELARLFRELATVCPPGNEIAANLREPMRRGVAHLDERTTTGKTDTGLGVTS